MRINYEQGEHGWGKVLFEVGNVEVEGTVSYLSEPLVDLANLARHVIDPENFGFRQARVSFQDEPGALVLHVSQKILEDTPRDLSHKLYDSGVITFKGEPPEKMQLHVKLERLDDGMLDEQEVGELLAEETITSLELARSIFRCLDEVSAKETAWSFLEKNVEAPFPLTEFALLGAMLGEKPRIRRLW